MRAMAAVGCGVLLSAGCVQVLGLGDYKDGNGGNGGEGTNAATGSETTSGKTTGSEATNASSNGSNGSGTGGAPACNPGDTQPCYDGLTGTENHAPCQAGTQTCDAQGQFESCEGEVIPAVEICSATPDENCDGYDCIEWSHLMGDQTDQGGGAVASDPSGDILFGGFFTGSIVVDANTTLISSGNNDAFLIKYDPYGAVLWSQKYGVAGDQYTTDVATDADGNVIFTGVFNGSVTFGTATYTANATTGVNGFIAKLDHTGAVLWSDSFPTGTSSNVAVAVDQVAINQGGGKIALAGNYVATNGGLSKAFLKTYSPAGVNTLSKTYGDATHAQNAEDVAIDSAGNLVLCGEFNGTITFGTGATATTLTSAGNLDAYLVKLDSMGGTAWAKSFGDANAQYGNSVVVGASGAVVFGGASYGTINFGGGAKTSAGDADVFIAKFSSGGAYTWGSLYGNGALQSLRALAIDKDENVLATGWNQGTINFGGSPLVSSGDNDLFLAKLTPTGTHVWSRSYGDDAVQLGQAVAATPTGEWALAAWMQGSFDVGQGPLTAAGGYDAFVARFGK